METPTHATAETNPDMPWMTGKPVEGSAEHVETVATYLQLKEGEQRAYEIAAELSLSNKFNPDDNSAPAS